MFRSRFLYILAILIPLLGKVNASEVSEKSGIATIKNLVNHYYADQAQNEHLNNRKFLFQDSKTMKISAFADSFNEPLCSNPDRTSCVEAVCSKLPSYLCDDSSDFQKVGEVCRNQYDGSCIKSACDKLPSYLCDDFSDLVTVGQACENTSGECINTICSRLPSYLCDDLSDIKKVGQICHGLYDGGCVSAVCARLPSYQCDDIDDFKKVVATCKGN